MDPKLIVPNREAVNHQQITTLLEITGALQAYLLPHRRLNEDEEAFPGGDIDGGCSMAAAHTFIKTCDRLDALLNATDRWDLEKNNQLIEALITTQQAHLTLANAQLRGAEDLARPSRYLKPMLLATQGIFVAVYGDIQIEGNAIIGRGATPEAALLDFDAAFRRRPEDQITIVSDQQAAEILPEGEQPPKKIRKK